MLPIDKACARVQFIGRIHGPMHAQRAYTRSACIHAPTPAILGISLSTPDITQLPRHLVTGVRVVFGQTYSPAALKRQRWTRWPTPPVEPLRHPVVISKHMPQDSPLLFKLRMPVDSGSRT